MSKARLMTVALALRVVVAVSFLHASAALFAQTSTPGDAVATPTVALVQRWSDGRRVFQVTSSRREAMFVADVPRIADVTPADGGAPVFAVHVVRELVGQDIKVDISIMRQSSGLPRVPVATVVVSPGSQVVVDALAAFGVQPVILSMTEVELTGWQQRPTVSSRSAYIDVAGVERLTAPYPGYRLTLRNLGAQPVASIEVQSYRQQTPALSFIKRHEDGRELIQPGESFTFDIRVMSDVLSDAQRAQTIHPLDRIELTSVRWADGTHDGEPRYPHIELTADSENGRRAQLRRVIEALHAAIAESRSSSDVVSRATARIARLPDAEPDQLVAAQEAMRAVKRTVVRDLDRLIAIRRSTLYDHDLLAVLVKRYETWLDRLSPLATR